MRLNASNKTLCKVNIAYNLETTTLMFVFTLTRVYKIYDCIMRIYIMNIAICNTVIFYFIDGLQYIALLKK